MKRLICAKEIEEMHERKEMKLYLEKDTIVTPAAQDAIKLYGIEVCEQKEPVADDGTFDFEFLYKVFQQMAATGTLNDVMKKMMCAPYECKEDKNGTKLIVKDSVKLHEGNRWKQVVIENREQGMEAGYCRLPASCEVQLVQQAEFLLLLKGKQEVFINETMEQIQAGDTLYIPENAKVKWGKGENAEAFYIRVKGV